MLSDIKFSIPIEILVEGFKDQIPNFMSAPISLDDRIMNQVIRPKVLVDCDIVGGTEIIVTLEGLPARFVDNYSTVYEIPADRLGYRTLLSVLSVGYVPFISNLGTTGLNYGQFNVRISNDVSITAQRVGDSHATMPIISNAHCDVIGNNTIVIRDQYRANAVYQLRCVVANEENMNNIPVRSFRSFSELCILAVKAYIYNKIYIRVGQAYLEGGQELAEFKNILDSYADANELYHTYLREVWGKVAFMSDGIRHTRWIKSMVNPGL
jgi:hypothetical protein